MDIFSARELAATIWIVSFIVFGLTFSGKGRKAFWQVIRAVFAIKLAEIWVLGFVWITLGVYLLYLGNLWAFDNLKDTIIWCVSAGVIVLVHGFSRQEQKPNYKKIIFDLFKLTVFLEVLANTYCFSLPTELLLFIFLFFTAAIQAYSTYKEENRDVHKLATYILIVLVGIMLWGTIKGLLNHPYEFFNTATLKNILQPILLTLWLLPVSYVLGVIGAYEILFLPFRIGEKHNLKFCIYARLKLIRHFGLRLNRVLEAPRKLKGRLYGISSIDELEKVLTSTTHQAPNLTRELL